MIWHFMQIVSISWKSKKNIVYVVCWISQESDEGKEPLGVVLKRNFLLIGEANIFRSA